MTSKFRSETLDLIHEILFMQEAEAELEAEKVMGLSDFFYERSGDTTNSTAYWVDDDGVMRREEDMAEDSSAKFSTLGASSYLDLAEDYVLRAANANPIIDANFQQLMTAVKKSLGTIFGREIIDLEGAGRMGFHIFDERASGEQAQWHVDMPFENEAIIWPEPVTSPFSFTLPLRLPRGVGGLDFREEEAGQESYYPYTTGNLYLYTGLFQHRIANPVRVLAGENRITLQGHGVFSKVSNVGFVYF